MIEVGRMILHDEKDYPEPLQFRPERFLKNGKMNPDIQDPELAVWGFGRRQVLPSLLTKSLMLNGDLGSVPVGIWLITAFS